MRHRPTNSDATKARAEQSFKAKEQRAHEGEKALAEYRAEGAAVLKNMAKLRESRLAKEAVDRDTPAPVVAKAKTKAKKR